MQQEKKEHGEELFTSSSSSLINCSFLNRNGATNTIKEMLASFTRRYWGPNETTQLCAENLKEQEISNQNVVSFIRGTKYIESFKQSKYNRKNGGYQKLKHIGAESRKLHNKIVCSPL